MASSANLIDLSQIADHTSSEEREYIRKQAVEFAALARAQGIREAAKHHVTVCGALPQEYEFLCACGQKFMELGDSWSKHILAIDRHAQEALAAQEEELKAQIAAMLEKAAEGMRRTAKFYREECGAVDYGVVLLNAIDEYLKVPSDCAAALADREAEIHHGYQSEETYTRLVSAQVDAIVVSKMKEAALAEDLRIWKIWSTNDVVEFTKWLSSTIEHNRAAAREGQEHRTKKLDLVGGHHDEGVPVDVDGNEGQETK